jgi:hypothetical protein
LNAAISTFELLNVVYDVKMRLDFRKKRQCFAVGSTIPKQDQRFTDDIPGDVKARACRSGLGRKILGSLVIDIALVEAGVEKRCVRKDAGWQGH